MATEHQHKQVDKVIYRNDLEQNTRRRSALDLADLVDLWPSDAPPLDALRWADLRRGRRRPLGRVPWG